jgi:type IV pilus assembly protein PilC
MGRLATVRERLIKGEGLAEPISDTQLFPPAASQMIRVGEATGTLDAQLDSASEFYEREVSYRIKKFTDMFEPLMILGMGFMVGFVALALVQAMYGVFGQVK